MTMKCRRRFRVFLETFYIDIEKSFSHFTREMSNAYSKSAKAILLSRERINRVCLRSTVT